MATDIVKKQSIIFLSTIWCTKSNSSKFNVQYAPVRIL